MSHPESPLTCRRSRVLLEAYLDGELRGPRRTQMDTHLAGCHACSQELLRARQIRGALRDLPPHACDDAVMDAVRARLNALAGPAPELGAATPARGVATPVPVSPPMAPPTAPPRTASMSRPSHSWGERVAGWWGSHGPGWRPAMVFGSMAVVALGGFLILHRPQHEQAVTAEDLRRADAQVRWVLATLGQINERTGERVRTEVFEKGVAEPTMRAVNGAIQNSVAQ